MRPWFTTLPFLNLIDCEPKACYHAIRFEKDSRYYVIRLSKDLLEDWVITLINGRINSKLGQSRTLAFNSFSEGFEHFCTQAIIRQQRGYQLININSDNYLLVHLLPFVSTREVQQELSATKIIKDTHQRKDKKTSSLPRKLIPKATHQQLGFSF